MESEPRNKSSIDKTDINYYVIVAIISAVVIFDIANALEPQVDSQLDFFELMRILGFGAAAIFAFSVAKRYFGSTIFGKAYLALGIGYGLYFLGDVLWYVYQVGYQVSNPYPYFPDIGYFGFYPFAIYHLRKNISFMTNGKLSTTQKAVLIAIPSVLLSLYLVAELVPTEVTGSIQDLSSQLITIDGTTYVTVPTTASEHGTQYVSIGGNFYNLVPSDLQTLATNQEGDKGQMLRLIPLSLTNVKFHPLLSHDQEFFNGFLMGIAYVAATSLTFAYALVGAFVFRGSILGKAWGLLLIGIGLNWIADIQYYFFSITYFDRSSPVHGIWLGGAMIVCYALYKHKKQI